MKKFMKCVLAVMLLISYSGCGKVEQSNTIDAGRIERTITSNVNRITLPDSESLSDKETIMLYDECEYNILDHMDKQYAIHATVEYEYKQGNKLCSEVLYETCLEIKEKTGTQKFTFEVNKSYAGKNITVRYDLVTLSG